MADYERIIIVFKKNRKTQHNRNYIHTSFSSLSGSGPSANKLIENKINYHV